MVRWSFRSGAKPCDEFIKSLQVSVRQPVVVTSIVDCDKLLGSVGCLEELLTGRDINTDTLARVCKYRNQRAREATCPAFPCATSTTARGVSAGQYHPCSFVPSSAAKKTSWNRKPDGSQSPSGNFEGKKSSSSSIEGVDRSIVESVPAACCARQRHAPAITRIASSRGMVACVM